MLTQRKGFDIFYYFILINSYMVYVHFGRCRYGFTLQEHADGVRIFLRHVTLNTVLFQLRTSQCLKGAKSRLPALCTTPGGGLDVQGILTFNMTGHTPV